MQPIRTTKRTDPRILATMKLRPFLMFQKRDAEAAMRFYMSLFDGSEVVHSDHYPDGTIKMAVFTLGGREVMCSDSPIQHAFEFTPSLSLFVECESEEQLDRVSAALLADGGKALMPPGAYGFSRKFAWVNDRFGVSWQLNLP